MPASIRLFAAFTSEIPYWGATPLAQPELLKRVYVPGGVCVRVSRMQQMSTVVASRRQASEKSRPTDSP